MELLKSSKEPTRNIGTLIMMFNTQSPLEYFKILQKVNCPSHDVLQDFCCAEDLNYLF
jgi:hypothetical protein